MTINDIDKAFETLFSILSTMPRFDESIAAKERLTEANFWLRHALNVKDMHAKAELEAKIAQEKKEAANSVREKVL